MLSMITADMNRLLIEATVQRTLERLNDAPEREMRNLIDMGLEFSEGRFQKQIFCTAQTMLQNPNSAYYTLVKHAASDISHERLLHFGMNVGYESCTKGAATIRAIEAKENFNIPWALTLSLNKSKLAKGNTYYQKILEQSTALGIYTTLLIVNDAACEVLPLLKSQPRMAFVLFVKGYDVTDEWLGTIQAVKNVMICVADDTAMPNACRKLYNARMLYGIYRTYNDHTADNVLSDAWLTHIQSQRPSFAILIAQTDCSPQTAATIYNFTKRMREEQHYPFILMALQQDLQLIDQIISDDQCMVGFDQKGQLHTIDGCSHNPAHNVFAHPLKDILKNALKK